MLNRFFLLIVIIATAEFSLGQNVGIGTATPQHAKLEVAGSVGNVAGIFGNGSQSGVSLNLGFPEVGLNYYFNGGNKAMAPGYASVLGMNPANGDLYIGNFNGNQAAAPFSDIAGYTDRFILKQNGRIGIGVSPTRAGFEQNGSVSNTAAIFGGEGSGISLQRNWPAVGFNHWYDGTNHRSIAQGYSAQLGLNQVNGSLYLASWPFAAIANANLDVNPFTQRFYISRFGRLGLGADDPWSDIHIIQQGYSTDGDPSAYVNGITLSSPNTEYWNISNGKIKTCVNVNLGILDPLGIIGSLVNGCTTYSGLVFSFNGVAKSCVRSDGEYRQLSDVRYKKNISSLKSNEGLNGLMQLRPVKYHFTDENENTQLHYGFIAQEVEKVFPQMVDEVNNRKVLGYQSLIPVLTKSVQEQQQEIEELKKEIETLKAIILSKK